MGLDITLESGNIGDESVTIIEVSESYDLSNSKVGIYNISDKGTSQFFPNPDSR